MFKSAGGAISISNGLRFAWSLRITQIDVRASTNYEEAYSEAEGSAGIPHPSPSSFASSAPISSPMSRPSRKLSYHPTWEDDGTRPPNPSMTKEASKELESKKSLCSCRVCRSSRACFACEAELGFGLTFLLPFFLAPKSSSSPLSSMCRPQNELAVDRTVYYKRTSVTFIAFVPVLSIV